MKRHEAPGVLAASLCFAAVTALSAAAGAAPLDLSTLAIQTAPTLPAPEDAPEGLPKAARVDGLFVGDTRAHNPEYGYSALGIFGDAESADLFARQAYYTSDLRVQKPIDRCFSVVSIYDGMPSDPAADWVATMARHAEIHVYDASPYMHAVRTERIVRDGSSVFVEGLELWVDSKTGGLREIGTNRLQLNKVATPLDGLEVFVARTGEEQVDVVVTRRPSKVERALADAVEGQHEYVLSSLGITPTLNGAVGQSGISSDCGHTRFRMHISDSPKVGEFFDSFSFFAARREAAVVNVSALLGYSNESPPRLSKLKDSNPRIGVVRSRPLAINVGLSKMSADEHPVLSVSYQWSGRESTIFAGDIVDSLGL